MPYVLNIAYAFLLVIASPWLLYSAIRKRKYREGFSQKFFGRVPLRSGERRCLWMHAVSVGEVNLLKPLLVEFERRHPGWDVVISTTTKAGFDLACQKYAPRSVFYCPLDFSWAVSAALRRVRPDLLILAELELWPNLIRLAKNRGTKIAVINGRLSEKSFRGYQWIRKLVKRFLSMIDLIAVQNVEYATRFLSLGAETSSVQITGSIKFDGAQSDRRNPTTCRLAELAGIEPSDVVLLAGSTQAPEEQMALETYCALASEFPQLRLIIVPRHPDRFDEVANLLDESKVSWQRRSQIKSPPDSSRRADQSQAPRVLLVDTIGELGAWWGTAQIAFVGGSMGSRGGQNMVEPAAYGAAVSFGPNTQNFRDIVSLLRNRHAAEMVADAAAFRSFVRRCLSEPNYARDLGLRAKRLVAEQQGATEKTMKLLESRGLVDVTQSAPRTTKSRAA